MVKYVPSIILLILSFSLSGQAVTYTYDYYYRITFIEKKGNLSDYQPLELLSARAIERRQKEGKEILDYRDIPVSPEDIKTLTDKGLVLHSTSRWMNSALMKSFSYIDLMELHYLPNVALAELVKKPARKSIHPDKLALNHTNQEIITYDKPITMLNGYALHDQGYKGGGKLIAVLDGGFLNAGTISSLEDLRNRNGIKATYDFVQNKENVYSSSTHGTAVLSILAGTLPFTIAGTAPDADYLLLKTEDVASEFPCEEDFWAAGAEFADSAGADIITSSLGYSTFDDPYFDYSIAGLDGKTSFVTRVAEIAASKGIIVVNSAGNERNKQWLRINFPADGENVIAVGAVDETESISVFSSAGPTYDNRIKPDLVALGVNVPLQTSNTSAITANGTSFSCPVISGMTACLMQAVPEADYTDITKVIRESADRYSKPDSLYGYGIPDMGAALLKLQDMYTRIPEEISVTGPNPTTGEFRIIFREEHENVVFEIFTMTGKRIWHYSNNNFAGRSFIVKELINKEQGVYFLRITTPASTVTHKIIKLKN